MARRYGHDHGTIVGRRLDGRFLKALRGAGRTLRDAGRIDPQLRLRLSPVVRQRIPRTVVVDARSVDVCAVAQLVERSGGRGAGKTRSEADANGVAGRPCGVGRVGEGGQDRLRVLAQLAGVGDGGCLQGFDPGTRRPGPIADAGGDGIPAVRCRISNTVAHNRHLFGCPSN